jgi:hypothetical protein
MTSRLDCTNLRVAAISVALTLMTVVAPAFAQSTLLPPACAGKTGAQLDQCVRDLTQPTDSDIFQPIEQKVDPRQLFNCLTVNRADEGFCIARNEIILECRRPAKYPDFDACANRLAARPQLPLAADCAQVAPAQRNQCALRNKVFKECLNDPWLYFICLGEKMHAK